MSNFSRLANVIKDLKELNFIEENDRLTCDISEDGKDIVLNISRFCYDPNEFVKRTRVIQQVIKDEFEKDNATPIKKLTCSYTELNLVIEFN